MKHKYAGTDDLTKLSDVCNRIANAVLEAPDHWEEFCLGINGVGLGYLALVGQLLSGVQAIAQIRMELAEMTSKYQIERDDAKEARDTMEELLGDREIESWRDDYYEKIVECLEKSGVKELVKHMLEDDDDE